MRQYRAYLGVKQLNDRLFDRHMSLELTDAAKDLLAQKGFDRAASVPVRCAA